jgi:hypothetical protein
MSSRLYGSNPIEAAQAVAVLNLQAENGFTAIRNNTARTGRWTSIQCIADAVFTKLTCPNNNGDNIDNITMVAGQTLCLGLITEITLASGSIVAANSFIPQNGL